VLTPPVVPALVLTLVPVGSSVVTPPVVAPPVGSVAPDPLVPLVLVPVVTALVSSVVVSRPESPHATSTTACNTTQATWIRVMDTSPAMVLRSLTCNPCVAAQSCRIAPTQVPEARSPCRWHNACDGRPSCPAPSPSSASS
jgi:hypothetical protein